MENLTYEKIRPYIDKGLVAEQIHPESNVVRIFNYTPETQFSRQWDEVTMQCRGLVMDVRTNRILARPFPKFFNYEEWVQQGGQIPATEPVKVEKMDGSLGILYWLNGTPRIATRGSFTSDQAIWATEWLHENVRSYPLHAERMTYLFEIIYPANRIVVSYNFSGLVPLAAIHTETGHQFEPQQFPDADYPHHPIAFHEPLESLRTLERENAEGFVVWWPEDGLRLKIKHKEYVRLHKLVTGLSKIAIWGHMAEGKPVDELLKDVPDEFYDWVIDVSMELTHAYNDIAHPCASIVDYALTLPDRKQQALYITKHSKQAGVCFAMLDEKDFSKLIWKLVRPHGNQPFKRDIDA
jgi:hypothetical protein